MGSMMVERNSGCDSFALRCDVCVRLSGFGDREQATARPRAARTSAIGCSLALARLGGVRSGPRSRVQYKSPT